MPSPDHPRVFRLLPWFSGISAVVITLIAFGNAWVISDFLTQQLFEREAVVSRDFVQNVLVSDGSLDYLANPSDAEARERFRGSVVHLANMRDVLRTNIYGRDQKVLWSSTPGLIGRQFDENDELDEALRGDMVVHAGRISPDARAKQEHEGLSEAASYFVETYIPVKDRDGQSVVGVIELYKVPVSLTESIQKAQMQVGAAALGGALLLYLSLFGLIRRADRTMQAQRQKLIDTETMAAVGELAASVAHNIRNPLASIRSSAELSLESMADHGEESARDILREVDRASNRVTQLLRLSHDGNASNVPVDIGLLLQDSVADHRETFARRQQTLALHAPPDNTRVLADAPLLLQVVNSLLANASEAMPSGGHCEVSVDHSANRFVTVTISDEGTGIAPEALKQAFRPFFTTKPQGMGLGLSLAHRIVERLGGTIALNNRPSGGTTVTLTLPRS